MEGRKSYKDAPIGAKYGNLQVVGPGTSRGNWTFMCSCGNIVEKRFSDVTSGKIKSCGCMRASKDSKYYTGRDEDGHLPVLYNKLCKIISRCYNTSAKDYPRYGGRGIKVCEEWLDDWRLFYDWCMDNGWEPGLSIDRIDNDGPYSPDNCRIANAQTQCNNRRSNHQLTYQGETHTMAEWSRIKGWPSTIIKGRVRKGWTVEKILTTPIQENKRRIQKE